MNLLARVVALCAAAVLVSTAQAGGGDLLRQAIETEKNLRSKTSIFERKPNYEAAIDLYSRALAAGNLSRSQRETALFNRAALRVEQGECKDAVADLSELLRSQPKNGSAYAARGSCLRALGELDSALEDFTRAVSLLPKDPMLRAERGEIYAAKKDYGAAISDYDASLQRLRPGESGDLYVARGDAYAAQANYEKAIEDYRSAIRVKRENAKRLLDSQDPSSELAPIYSKLGDAYHALAKRAGKGRN